MHESAGQNRICRAAYCRTEQDRGGQCIRVQDRTGYAGQDIMRQNWRVVEVQTAVPRTRFTLCSLAGRYNSSLSSAERALPAAVGTKTVASKTFDKQNPELVRTGKTVGKKKIVLYNIVELETCSCVGSNYTGLVCNNTPWFGLASRLHGVKLKSVIDSGEHTTSLRVAAACLL